MALDHICSTFSVELKRLLIKAVQSTAKGQQSEMCKTLSATPEDSGSAERQRWFS
jgi:hypothetical protein